MVYVRRFDAAIGDADARLTSLHMGVEFATMSADLQTILQTFLHVGNELNEGTRVGNFEAFALSTAASTLGACVSPLDKRVSLRSYAVSLIPDVVSFRRSGLE